MGDRCVRFGVIGCGWIVDFAHIPALTQISNGKLSALFDVDIERAKELGSKWGVMNVYNDLEQFFSSEIEAVIIATPNSSHVYYTIEALKRGIHVLCEKPVAFHADEVEEIMETAKTHNAIYIPGFVNRWREDIQKVYKEIQAGTIGKIQKVEAGWLRRIGVPRPGTWFTNRKYAGGGVLTDLGSHVMDICLFFLGEQEAVSYELVSSICNSEKIQKVGGANWFQRNDAAEFSMDVEDTIIADVRFKNNISLQVKISWLAPVEGDCTYFRIYGTDGNMQLKTLFGFSNDRLWENDVLEITNKETKKEYILNEDRTSAKNAFVEMLRYFTESILTQETNFTNGNDAKRTVSLIENLYQVEQVNAKRIEDEIQEVFE